jgi:tetratricopeptide (TPR) repeat protein
MELPYRYLNLQPSQGARRGELYDPVGNVVESVSSPYTCEEKIMFELKRLSDEAIPAALEKALRYRLLNEPAEAESICHDVLQIDPENQQALVVLLLALTDRFGKGYTVGILRAEEVLSRLRDAYERAYYAGVICERRAKAQLRQGYPGAGHDAYELLLEAMSWSNKPKRFVHPKTTMRCCAGTPVPVSSWATSLRAG